MTRVGGVIHQIGNDMNDFWKKSFKVLLLCWVCYFPGALIIDTFDVHWLGVLPAFWGGMVYQACLPKMYEDKIIIMDISRE